MLRCVLLWVLLCILGSTEGGTCPFRPDTQFEEELSRLFSGCSRFADDGVSTDALLDTLYSREQGKSQGIVLFGLPNSAAKDSVVAVKNALFGSNSCSFPEISMPDVVNSVSSLEEAREELKRQLKTQIEKSPDRVILFATGFESLKQEYFPVMDVFLDMLNNERPFLQVGESVLGCGGVTVFFLFEQERKNQAWSWQETLEKEWSFDGTEFTTNALVGRLAKGIAFQSQYKTISMDDTPSCTSGVVKPPAAGTGESEPSPSSSSSMPSASTIVTLTAVLVLAGIAFMRTHRTGAKPFHTPPASTKRQPQPTATATSTAVSANAARAEAAFAAAAVPETSKVRSRSKSGSGRGGKKKGSKSSVRLRRK